MAEDQGRRDNRPPFKITSFEVAMEPRFIEGIPGKEDPLNKDRYEFDLSVIVAHRSGGAPREIQQVVCDMGSHVSQHGTGPGGKIIFPMYSLLPGIFVAGARLANDPPNNRITIPVVIRELTEQQKEIAALEHRKHVAGLRRDVEKAEKGQEEEKPKLKKLAPPAVEAAGDEGSYKISVSISYDDGESASDIPVRFLISKLGKPAEIHDEATDDRGFATYDLEFKEKECDVVVQIRSYEHKIDNLYGPSRYKRIEIPEPSEKGLSGSFWQIIKRAWKGEGV